MVFRQTHGGQLPSASLPALHRQGVHLQDIRSTCGGVARIALAAVARDFLAETGGIYISP